MPTASASFARESLQRILRAQGCRRRLEHLRRLSRLRAACRRSRGARRCGGARGKLHRRGKPAPALSVRAAERGAVRGAHAGRCGPGRRTRASSWRSRSARISRARVELNAKLHEVFAEEQIFRIDHFLGKEPAQNILAFRFANGLFEPIWNRNFIDHVQIDVPETLGARQAHGVLRIHGRVSRHGGDAPVPDPRLRGDGGADAPVAAAPSAKRRSRCFAACCRSSPADVVRGQYIGYRGEEGVAPESDTETFIALKCSIDNWRWAGVPFYLRTGKRLAEGQRIISIAFREPPKSMFPEGLGHRRARTRSPDLRSGGCREDLAVVLRQAARARHDASTSTACSSR